ncbi:MAG: hypothetical protein KJ077_28850 [Anaerolineae bacterium]|nr:hypothetical protein [Anaerolineae bacterium]
MGQQFEIKKIIRQSHDLVSNTDITEPLTRKDLVRLTHHILGLDEKDTHAMTYGKIRTLEDTPELISPDTRVAGAKTFYYYSRDDLERVIAAKILELQYNLPLKKAKFHVSASWFNSGLEISSPTDQVQKTDQSIITVGATRANRYVWTRSLKYVLTLLFGELPTDTYIIVDRSKKSYQNHSASSLIKVNSTTEDQRQFETSDNRIAARINQSSMVYIEPVLRIDQGLHIDPPESFEVYDDAEDMAYCLNLYLPSDFSLRLTSDGKEMLSSLGTHQAKMTSTLFRLAFQRYHASFESQDLTAMVEAILQILPEFDYCGILLPQKGQYLRDRLEFRYYTKNFPEELKTAKVISGDLVAGWVHKERLPLFVEGIEANDSRVSELEKDFTTIAAAPMWSYESWGVLYAARQREIESGKRIITPVVQDLFTVLAGIAGELGYNESLIKKNTENAVRVIRAGSPKILDDSEICDKLKSEFAWIQSTTPDKYKAFNLSAMVVSIENLEDIAELCGTNVGNWLEQQIPEIASELLGRGVKGRYDIFRLQPGRFVFLLQRTPSSEDEIKNVAINLKRLINSITLTTPNGPQEVEFLSWGIVYSYNGYLRRKLGGLKNSQAAVSPEQPAETLYKRFYEAAMALRPNEQGHAALARRDYASAFNFFADAWAIAPESPYYLKHMAEALVGSENYIQALKYCEDALNLDPDYAGGYYMKAEILTALEKSDEATVEYQKAIDISPRAKHYWLFGTALTISGKYDLAIQQFKRARELDDSRHNSKYDLLIARVLKLRGESVEARNKLITISTEEDSGDEILVQFETKLLDANL